MYILDPVKMLENTVVNEKSVPIHPQEQAAKIRMEEERQKRVSVFVFIPISVVMLKKKFTEDFKMFQVIQQL